MLCNGFLPKCSYLKYLKLFFNRFERDGRHKEQVPVRIINDKGLSGVKFYRSPKLEKEKLLCSLNFRVSPLKREFKVRLTP